MNKTSREITNNFAKSEPTANPELTRHNFYITPIQETFYD